MTADFVSDCICHGQNYIFPKFRTNKISGRAAGTSWAMQGAQGCKHFLFRFCLQQLQSIFSQTWNAFSVPRLFFLHFPSLLLFLMLTSSVSGIQLFIWQLERQEKTGPKGSQEESLRFLLDIIGTFLQFPPRLIFKAAAKLRLPVWDHVTMWIHI